MRWLSAALILVVSAAVSFVVLWLGWVLILVYFGGRPQPPMATICANALRCTEHLVASAGAQPTPA